MRPNPQINTDKIGVYQWNKSVVVISYYYLFLNYFSGIGINHSAEAGITAFVNHIPD